MRRNFLSAALVTVLLTLVMTGPACGQFLESPYFQKVRAGGPLVVVMQPNTPPFCLVDEQGQPHGLDVEIARLLGEALDTEIRIVLAEFKDIIPGLEDGTFDLAISNLTITTRRAARVAFSHGYLEITQGALLDRRYIPRRIVEGVVQDVPIRSFADLAKIPGLVLGTWGHTTSAEIIKEFHPDLEQKIYPDIMSARRALHDGEINALVADSPIIEFFFNYFKADRKRFKALTRPTTRERLGIALHMGDPSFNEFLNEFVDELRADGTLDRLFKKYVEDTSWAGEVLR